MQQLAPTRSVARCLGLIWLLACSANLAAQDMTTPAQPSAVAPAQWPAATSTSSSYATMRVAQERRTAALDNAPSTSGQPQTPLRLNRPSQDANDNKGHSAGGLQSLIAIGGSLAAVLGVFFLLVWVMRRASPQGLAVLPNEVFTVLGRAALAQRQQVQLLRLGGKLLLVSVTPTGVKTLTEINDAQEVERLTSLCRSFPTHAATATFRRVFDQLTAKHSQRETPPDRESEAYGSARPTPPRGDDRERTDHA